MGHTLESHRLFPVVAWTLVIGFAFFTYSLTMRVQKDLEHIAGGVERLEVKLNNLEAKNAMIR